MFVSTEIQLNHKAKNVSGSGKQNHAAYSDGEFIGNSV